LLVRAQIRREFTLQLRAINNFSCLIPGAVKNDEILTEFWEIMKQENTASNVKNRRSFLKGTLTAGAAVAGASALSSQNLLAQHRGGFTGGRLTSGDVAILKFLAAAELIEADLWQQYAELGGLTPGQLPWKQLRSRP
jgi:hypothetical protein